MSLSFVYFITEIKFYLAFLLSTEGAERNNGKFKNIGISHSNAAIVMHPNNLYALNTGELQVPLYI